MTCGLFVVSCPPKIDVNTSTRRPLVGPFRHFNNTESLRKPGAQPAKMCRFKENFTFYCCGHHETTAHPVGGRCQQHPQCQGSVEREYEYPARQCATCEEALRLAANRDERERQRELQLQQQQQAMAVWFYYNYGIPRM
jgi:hypothetical protein